MTQQMPGQMWPPQAAQTPSEMNVKPSDQPDSDGGVDGDATRKEGFGTDTAVAPVTPKLVRKSAWNAAIGFACKVARRAAMSVVDWSKKRLMSADTDTEAKSCLRLDATNWMLETTTLDKSRL